MSTSLVEEMKVQIQEFFKLPIEEKIKYDQLEGDIEGYGQAFVVSQEQKLDWADIFYMVTLPKKLRKPHLFPKLPLPFRSDRNTNTHTHEASTFYCYNMCYICYKCLVTRHMIIKVITRIIKINNLMVTKHV